MSKIICNSVDYVFSEGILVITPESVILKPGYSWKNLPVKEKPSYSSDINQNDAGPIRNESVTAVTRFNEDSFLKKQIAHGVVLRMKTDDSTFYVGSDRYPCMIEVSDDRITDTFTFEATSIV